MATKIHTTIIAGITDLKRDPMSTVEGGNGEPVLILNRNEPAFYCVPVPTFEDMVAQLPPPAPKKK